MRIKHVPCPKCREQGKDRSGDNLAMYPDGGGFCFSCGFNLPTKTYTAPSQSFAGKRVEDAELPVDAENYLSVWLDTHEIKQHFLYDKQYDRIVLRDTLPIYYWGKSYVSGRKPKVYTEGTPPAHVFGGYKSNENLVLVEDPISAIAVSRNIDLDVLPLFGCVLPVRFLRYLSLMPKKNLYVWLDNDKKKEGLAMCMSLRHLFKCHWINTTFDPKSYRMDEVKKILGLDHVTSN